MSLTAIIICRSRREKGFKRALNSVEFADEILVEERRTIADYAAVRNEVLEKAGGEWVVFVDGDEIISEDLSSEIKSQISNLKSQNHNSKLKTNTVAGFFIKRKDYFLGKWLRHGETASVRLLRLGRKGAGRWERPVHEVWKIGGRIGELRHPLLHYSHQSVDEMVEKLDRYSEIEAEYRFYKTNKLTKKQTNKKTNKSLNKNIIKTRLLTAMAMFPLGKFVWNYFLRLGFLDGMEGFIHALMMSGHSFLVRAKILEKVEESRRK